MKTIILVALVGFAVHGATVTFNYSFASPTTNWGHFSTITGGTIDLPGFDLSLGTIISDTISGNFTVIGDILIESLLASTITQPDFTLRPGIRVSMYDKSSVSQRHLNGLTALPITGAQPNTAYSFPGGLNISEPLIFSCIAGDCPTGPRGWVVDITPWKQVDEGTPNFSYTANATITITATRTFEYTPAEATTPVPEPSSWALIATGLGGLAYCRRRD